MGNTFNSSERYLAKFLSRFPQVKATIKRVYQQINYLLYKKPYTYKSFNLLQSLPINSETFFGYYDKSPLSENNRYILYYQTDYSTKNLPDAFTSIQLSVFDLGEKKVIYNVPVSSYNWQQGARAQWLTQNSFIFNNYNPENKYHSIIVDLSDKSVRIINRPVYDCYKKDYALTLNFNRLMALRPDYGYRNLAIDFTTDISDLDNDGIFKTDLTSGVSKLIISLQTLKNDHNQHRMEDATHKVNHIMVSPDGEHFIFLHRYYVNKRRFDRMFVADKNGRNLKLLADDDMVSHYIWADNENVIVYLRDLLLGDKYYRVNINTGKKEILGKGILDKFGDGHPTIYKNQMIFDTYPNKSRIKELFLFDLNSQELKKIGEFYESLGYYGQSRCDLHPRFSSDGKKVFFDSVHEGKRQLYWMQL